MGLWRTGGSPNLGQKTRPYNNQQKKKNRIWKIVDFAVPADDRSTSTLLGNFLKNWNMRVTIIPILIGAFGTVTKGLLKGLEDLEVGGRGETIQTTALLRTTRILMVSIRPQIPSSWELFWECKLELVLMLHYVLQQYLFLLLVIFHGKIH